VKPTSLVLAALLAFALVLMRRRLTRTQLGIGTILAGWLLVRGTGAVHLPSFEETAKEVGPSLGAWTYLLVGAMAFLETAFFVGLVAPGEFTVVLGGFFAAQGAVDIAVLAPTVFACAAAGDTTSFYLGRRLGRGFLLRHGRPYGISEQGLDLVERIFRRHGAKTILIGRFLGLVRALAPFVAGASRVPARRFLALDYLAAAIWSATFLSLGYVFWRSFDTVISIAKSSAVGLGSLVVALAVGIATFRWLRDPTNRERAGRAWRSRTLRPLRD
jgi:membrane protein DedA with SNARE-associated domain